MDDQRHYGSVHDPTAQRSLSISLCTSADQHNIKGLQDELYRRFRDKVDVVNYFKLPYNDLDNFSLVNKGLDVVVLCHSIHNRRFAITDVMDALYDVFLPRVKNVVGKRKVCVIVHDLPLDKLESEEKYENEMRAFRLKQPKTFDCASTVIIGGKLERDQVELSEDNWRQLVRFINEAAYEPEVLPAKEVVSPCEVLMVFLILSAIALFVGLLSSLTQTRVPWLPTNAPHVPANTAPTTASTSAMNAAPRIPHDVVLTKAEVHYETAWEKEKRSLASRFAGSETFYNPVRFTNEEPGPFVSNSAAPKKLTCNLNVLIFMCSTCVCLLSIPIIKWTSFPTICI